MSNTNKRTTGDKIADALALATLAVCLLAVFTGNAAHAGTPTAATAATGATATGKVSFVATLKGGPAMQPVDWVVQPTGATGGTDIHKAAHSFTTELKVGTYRAVAMWNGTTRFRDFTVTGNLFAVVVAMD